MKRTLLTIGGVAHAGFCLHQVWLAWRLDHGTVMPEGVRSGLDLLTAGGALLFGFFAFVTFVLPLELVSSRVGLSVLGLIILVYASRGLAEVLLARDWNVALVLGCLAIAALHAAVVVLVFREEPFPLRAELSACGAEEADRDPTPTA